MEDSNRKSRKSLRSKLLGKIGIRPVYYPEKETKSKNKKWYRKTIQLRAGPRYLVIIDEPNYKISGLILVLLLLIIYRMIQLRLFNISFYRRIILFLFILLLIIGGSQHVLEMDNELGLARVLNQYMGYTWRDVEIPFKNIKKSSIKKKKILGKEFEYCQLEMTSGNTLGFTKYHLIRDKQVGIPLEQVLEAIDFSLNKSIIPRNV